MSQTASSSLPVREAITAFLQERLQAKLDKLKNGQDDERQKLQDTYRPENWIADAARRVGQIQQVSLPTGWTACSNCSGIPKPMPTRASTAASTAMRQGLEFERKGIDLLQDLILFSPLPLGEG